LARKISLLGTTLIGLGTFGFSEDDEVFLLGLTKALEGAGVGTRPSVVCLLFLCLRGVRGGTSVRSLDARSAKWFKIFASSGGYAERRMTGEAISMSQTRKGACRRTASTIGFLEA
jgi:hypothetical protein